MKCLKNKSIFFKLIVALFICLTTCNFMFESVVHAVHKASDDHGEIVDTIISGDPPNMITETIYEDGCTYNSMSGWSLVQEDGSHTGDSTGTPSENLGGTGEDLERAEAIQGGKLLQPVVDLLLTLGDGIMDIIQSAITDTEGHITVDLRTSLLATFLGILAALAVVLIITAVSGGIGTAIAAFASGVHSAFISGALAGITKVVTIVLTITAGVGGLVTFSAVSGKFMPEITVLPTYTVSPQEIFEGKLLVFDIDFFNPKKQVYIKFVGEDYQLDGSGTKVEAYNPQTEARKIEAYYYIEDGEAIVTSKQNTAMELSPVIAKWYYTIRNIALVVMMLILVYVGIRMMLCSIAAEKSKYKKMLGDWLISICLVFVLHYIMVFAVNITENIVDLISVATSENGGQSFGLDLRSMDNKDKFIDVFKNDEELRQCLLVNGQPATSESEAEQADYFLWPTNLVGRVRMMAQVHNGSSEYVGYAIAFIVLVFYTIFFAFTYLKRVIYLAFLTVIAPLVAMTYSIDKMNDGNAQAFNKWLKEYIFNLIIQPVHLLLYMLLISMAIDLAAKNIIYTLVAIGFMMPAEKLIRSMFGFEKATTPGFLGGAAGAAVAMGVLSKLTKLGGSKGALKSSGNKSAGKLDKSEDSFANKNLGSGTLNNLYNDDDNSQTSLSLEDGGRSVNDSGENGSDSVPTLDASIERPDGFGNSNTERSAFGAVDGLGSGNSSQGDEENPDSPDNINFADIDNAEKSANPMDYLSDEEREQYMTDKAIADRTHYLEDVNKVKAWENKANEQKKTHFQQQRNTRMLEESKRRQQAERQRQAQQAEIQKQREQAQAAAAQKKYQSYGSTFKRMAKKRLAPENLANAVATTAKAGIKLTAIGVGAGLGASMAIASGSPKDIPQDIAVGATAGNAIGGMAGNFIDDLPNKAQRMAEKNESTKHEWAREKYGDEQYKEYLKEEQRNKIMKDKDLRNFYEREYNSTPVLAGKTKKERRVEMDKIMEDVAEYYVDQNVKDHNIIAKAMKLEPNKRNAKDSKAAAIMASRVKNIKELEEQKKKLTAVIGAERAAKIAKNAEDIGKFF